MLSSVERSWAVPVVHMLSSVERSGPFLVPSGKHVRVCARASTVCARRVLRVRTLRDVPRAVGTWRRARWTTNGVAVTLHVLACAVAAVAAASGI